MYPGFGGPESYFSDIERDALGELQGGHSQTEKYKWKTAKSTPSKSTSAKPTSPKYSRISRAKDYARDKLSPVGDYISNKTAPGRAQASKQVTKARGALASVSAKVNNRLDRTWSGRLLRESALESVGFHYEGGQNRGFLGIKSNLGRFGDEYELSRLGKNSRYTSAKAALKNSGVRNPYSTYKGVLEKGGTRSLAAKTAFKKTGVRGAAKFLGGTGLRAIPLLSTAYFMAEGYSSNGLTGVASGFGEGVATTFAWKAAASVLGAGASAAVGIAGLGLAGVGVGVYQAGEAASSHVRGLKRLEMGGGHMQGAIESHGASTMRQRSLQNLNNSHINGRMALGNEAFLMHRPFR